MSLTCDVIKENVSRKLIKGLIHVNIVDSRQWPIFCSIAISNPGLAVMNLCSLWLSIAAAIHGYSIKCSKGKYIYAHALIFNVET